MTLAGLESAKFWADMLAVGLAVLTAVAGVAALYFSLRLSAAKDAELARFQSESRVAISAADARAAEANQNAASATEGTAKALANAAEANKLAEGFRLDIAKANERAAAANETAEKERLARLQLEARLADRVINDSQKTRLREAFATIKGETVEIGIFGDNPDIARVTDAITEAVVTAGVLITGFSPAGGTTGVRGVIIGVRSDAPAAVKKVAETFVITLRETLGAGVAMEDFSKLTYGGVQTGGGTPGALPKGSAPLRIWIGSK